MGYKKVHFATVHPPTTLTARRKYPRIKHDAESLKYIYQDNRCMATGSNCRWGAALGCELTTLKPGSSMCINPNRHIILVCMHAKHKTMAAVGKKITIGTNFDFGARQSFTT